MIDKPPEVADIGGEEQPEAFAAWMVMLCRWESSREPMASKVKRCPGAAVTGSFSMERIDVNLEACSSVRFSVEHICLSRLGKHSGRTEHACNGRSVHAASFASQRPTDSRYRHFCCTHATRPTRRRHKEDARMGLKQLSGSAPLFHRHWARVHAAAPVCSKQGVGSTSHLASFHRHRPRCPHSADDVISAHRRGSRQSVVAFQEQPC